MDNTVLVHVCCAPCSTYSCEKLLKDGYKIKLYFYNPNIYPESEYERRKEEVKTFCLKKNYDLVIDNDTQEVFMSYVKGLEEEKEGGIRCEHCFRLRLEKTARKAKEMGINSFTTVLTVSPYKNAKVINQVGSEIADKYGIEFIKENFKKQDGFKKSSLLSKQYNLYRQTYCGCIYSNKIKN